MRSSVCGLATGFALALTVSLYLMLSVFILAATDQPEAGTGPVPALPNEARYDLVVVGGTPGGAACAVRAARQGLRVLLVEPTAHLGGILANGLSVWDTLYEGRRAPIYDELRQAIFDHYRTTYGEQSPQYRNALPGPTGHSNGKFEPHVAERLIDAMVAREERIKVLHGHVVVAVERDAALIQSIRLRALDGDGGGDGNGDHAPAQPRTLRVSARVFADCTYEGDLAVLAEVPYRVGREARTEFAEPHAGLIYMRPLREVPAPESIRRLALRHFGEAQAIVTPESTGAADTAVQGLNFRTILSSDPKTRIIPEKPGDYDPEFLRHLEYGSIVSPIPNNKICWNRPQLIGPHQAYIEGDRATRRRVSEDHRRATLGLLYFLQNDPSVPAEKRAFWRRYGLARDEFADNGYFPRELYVREARRIVGRAVFTEHDARPAAGLERAPVHGDSIGVTEWYLDTHACTPGRVRDSLDEGKMMLHFETVPGQLPYRCLLPRGVDNLLVPVCLSATHVAWGTVRLEPTWMHLGESAGHAAALSVRLGKLPAALDPETLLCALAEGRVMLAFFNDVDVAAADGSFVPAVEYLATKGFFPTYNARPGQPLSSAVARHWARMCGLLAAGRLDPMAEARTLYTIETSPDDDPITVAAFATLLQHTLANAGTAPAEHLVGETVRAMKLEPDAPIGRAQACELIYRMRKPT